MHSYSTLREVVRGAGGTLVEEHLCPDAFCSAYAVFAGCGPRFRLVWDGKENYGLLQVQSAPGQWKDRGPLVRERVGESFSDMPAFLATVGRLVAGTEES